MKKKITVSIEEEVLTAARRHADKRGPSVHALVSEFLADLQEGEERMRQARRRLQELSERPQARIDSTSWTRDELWFRHPEAQERITEAEDDFAAGRSTRTETTEDARALLDDLKKQPTC